MESYDYIVIGAGSAGCVVATRLVRAGKSVLLLEAGPHDRALFLHIPATGFKHYGTRRMWQFMSEPEAGALGRRMPMTQARTLGGGSSVNGMVYIRGQRQDYDGWRDSGCPGWGYDDVLPLFKRAENNQRLANGFHGTEGPLKVSDSAYRHPLAYAFVRAAQEAGLRYNDDFNGERQDGVGFYQATMATAQRQSTAATYLALVRHSPLLTLRCDSLVEAILFENGAAIGVRYRAKDNAIYEARIREEVVLSAGTFGSAKALQLSGIGSAEFLAPLGIEMLRDLPGVGENFQDHISASTFAQLRDPISLMGADKGLQAVRHGLQYLFFRSGLLASNVFESGGFVDTSNSGRPDIQFLMVPILLGDGHAPPPVRHGITIRPGLLRPSSRGTVRITSRAPGEPVAIKANALSTRDDVETLMRGVKLARRIMHAPSLRAHIERELAPGDGSREPSDDQIETHVRRVAKSMFHPVGTCRMGRGAGAVVDPQLRVIGVPRLRVADASIMPALVSGNTNAPAIMIGERCADFLLGGTVA